MPNSDRCAICSTLLIAKEASHGTSAARAPRTNGPRITPVARNPNTGLICSLANSGTITPAVPRKSSSSL